MKKIISWTKKLIGSFFPIPKYAPLLPRDLTATARRTLSFGNIPTHHAHLDLFEHCIGILMDF